MADRDPVLAAWQAAGTSMTMLPSGMEVRLEEVPVVEMVRSGFLPGQLRAIAMRFASKEGVEPSKMEREEQDRWAELERLMICRWVVAVRWICECADCIARRQTGGLAVITEQPYALRPEMLAADPPVLPRVDLAALSDIVTYVRTARTVDVMSRVAHEQLPVEEAARVIEAERVNTIEGWASFRGQQRGVDADAHRQDVGQPPVEPADHLDAGGRVRPRRGARRPTPPRKRATAKQGGSRSGRGR